MQRAEAFTMAGLGALVGGVLGGLVTFWLVGSASPKLEKERAAASAGAAEEAPADIEDRLAALERSVGRLRGGNAVRSLMAAQAASAAASPGKPGADAPGGDENAGGDPVIDNPVFEAAVRDVVDRIQEERESERELERAERRRQWSDQWTNDLATSLKLNETQKAKMREIADQFWERLREFRNSDAGRPSRQERRARMSALREETEGKMAQVLDPSQMSAYKELDDDMRLGARFGREFRRRGD